MPLTTSEDVWKVILQHYRQMYDAEMDLRTLKASRGIREIYFIN